MKIHTLLVLALLAVPVLSAGAIPPIIGRGFTALEKDGAEAAWKQWGIEYGAKTEEYKNWFLAEMKKTASYGQFLGYDPIVTVSAGQHYEDVYVLVRYETSAIFYKFTCYRPKKEWIIKNIAIRPHPEGFVPGFPRAETKS